MYKKTLSLVAALVVTPVFADQPSTGFDCQSEVSAPIAGQSTFLSSGRYCFTERPKNEDIDVNRLPHADKVVAAIASRYGEAYGKMNTVEKKVQFVDLFLLRFSREYVVHANLFSSITNGKPLYESVSLTGYRPEYESILDQAWPIFSDGNGEVDPQREQLLSVLILMAQNNPLTPEYDNYIVDVVNWVLGTPGKKSFSPSHSVQNDGGTWEADSEYENWAKEQAENWCNDCSSSWIRNFNSGLAYLLITSRTEMWPAYHYYRSWTGGGTGGNDPFKPIPPR
ncbi:hypothetical protein [Thalassomonas sp. RHCl1]|uniref:hypothetical protein n=1 Tax=Thalassomonas sp. RHCl1 TaxID=2995320 RepID=UPI00248AB65B|nr:hypothetical protein [Thalassomonas sp. RHCl1]